MGFLPLSAGPGTRCLSPYIAGGGARAAALFLADVRMVSGLITIRPQNAVPEAAAGPSPVGPASWGVQAYSTRLAQLVRDGITGFRGA